MEVAKKDGTNVKKGVGFIYLSVVIHCYLLFMALIVIDPSFLRTLLQMAQGAPKQEETENIIVDTQTETTVTPDAGLLSDKANQDAALKPGDKNYNYLNTVPGKEDSPASPLIEPSKQKQADDRSGGAEVTLDKNPAVEKKDNGKQSLLSEPSDKRTSYYDPDKGPDVTMDNYGEISLSTVPKEYASYFLDMQKKIGNNWKDFFPVFQYYQGIIKSGEVVVRFRIDPDGNVRDANVVKSYGYSILDESSLNAVNYSRNFGPLPKALRYLGPLNIHFRFIYIAR